MQNLLSSVVVVERLVSGLGEPADSGEDVGLINQDWSSAVAAVDYPTASVVVESKSDNR